MIFLSYTQSESRFFIEDSDQNFNAKQGDSGVASKRYGKPGGAVFQVEGELNRDPRGSKVNVATKKICFPQQKKSGFSSSKHIFATGWRLLGRNRRFRALCRAIARPALIFDPTKWFSPRSRVTTRLFMNFLRKLCDNPQNLPRLRFSSVRSVHCNRRSYQTIRVKNRGIREFNMASHTLAKVFRR